MNYSVAQLMTDDVLWIDENANFKKVIELINCKNLSHLIVKSKDKAVGVISRVDIYNQLLHIAYNSTGKRYMEFEMQSIKAKDIMSTDLISINRNTSTNESIDLMIEHHIHCLPVINEEQELEGIVTPLDILQKIV